jgi:hypothetical protein
MFSLMNDGQGEKQGLMVRSQKVHRKIVRAKMGLILSAPLEHGQFGNIKDDMCLMVHLLKWLVFFCSLEELHDWGLTRARGISYIFALVPDGE